MSQVSAPVEETAVLPEDPQDAAETATPEPPDRPWRRAAIAALIIWSAAYVAYAVFTLFSWRIPLGQMPDLQHMLGGFKTNDVNYYVGIAEIGYADGHPDARAFYPLFPIAIWAVNFVVPGGALIAAAVVSAICAYFCLMVLYRFVDHEFGATIASRTLLYLAAFPMAYFLYHAYNSSMFLLLSIGALYAGRRGHWWLAGSLAGLAGGTRLFGLLLAAPLAYEYLRQSGWNLRRAVRWEVLSFGLVPLGLVAYSVYCHFALGSWRAFIDAQDAWGRYYGWPGQSLFEALKLTFTQGPTGPGFVPTEFYLITMFEALTVLFALILVVLGFVGPWKVRRDQWFLLVASLVPIVVICSTMLEMRWLMSAPRYALEWTAAFVILARMGRHQFVDRLYLMLGFGLQALMFAATAMHTNWVA
ncbi:glycosyltransferase family 87 protein [Paractinoplanes rishiriensis]|uniref:Integral membrane protein n=1 Tax=Paractinoplanes rishiriensis TaxID=1050105 RepID=A0A919MYL6_9ACTN|nr:glycosyltransferase family 87 protein [Actinoplanes rishiriensis]GIE97190.1 hypothetical protein Ari01nite_46550 [Actinoplanes rishiriensis]